MKTTLVAAITIVLSCTGCSIDSGDAAFAVSEDVGSGFHIEKRPLGRYCLTSDNDMPWMCEATSEATEVGWNNRYIGIRIDVPSKEYLLVDKLKGLVWVLPTEEFRQAIDAEEIQMGKIQEVWMQLRRSSV